MSHSFKKTKLVSKEQEKKQKKANHKLFLLTEEKMEWTNN